LTPTNNNTNAHSDVETECNANPITRLSVEIGLWCPQGVPNGDIFGTSQMNLTSVLEVNQLGASWMDWGKEPHSVYGVEHPEWTLGVPM
jgi:hypothetical protein